MKLLSAVDIGKEFGSPFGVAGGKTPSDLISFVITLSLVVAGLIVLVMFIMAGISLIASAGQSNPENAEKAKKTATSAAIGFVIVFCAYWIIKLLEVIIGIPFITSPTF